MVLQEIDMFHGIYRTIADSEMGIIIEGEIIYPVIKAKCTEEVMVAENNGKIDTPKKRNDQNRNPPVQLRFIVNRARKFLLGTM